MPEEPHPSEYPRGHPLRDSYEAEQISNQMTHKTIDIFAGDTKIPKAMGENERNFELHHNFLPQSLRNNLSEETLECVNKLLGITNVTDKELLDMEYFFDILTIKEMNYSKRSEYSPAKSKAMEDLKLYFYAQIRRSRDGWEREKETEERKVLKTDFPIAKRKPSWTTRLFGG